MNGEHGGFKPPEPVWDLIKDEKPKTVSRRAFLAGLALTAIGGVAFVPKGLEALQLEDPTNSHDNMPGNTSTPVSVPHQGYNGLETTEYATPHLGDN